MRLKLLACALLLVAASARAAPLPAPAPYAEGVPHRARVVKPDTRVLVRDAPGRVVTREPEKRMPEKRVLIHRRVATGAHHLHPVPHAPRVAVPGPAGRAPVHPRHAAHAAAIRPAPRPVVPVVAPPPPPAPKPAPAVDPNKGTATGLPLPRYAALRSDQVSFRAGPGTRYPIQWIYQRRDLPVKIEREFEVWRLVSVPDGFRGWVHLAMLTGRRGFLVAGDQPTTLRAAADPAAAPVAILKPGVVGRLIGCPSGSAWCSAEVKTYRGYVSRDAIAGLLPGEAISP